MLGEGFLYRHLVICYLRFAVACTEVAVGLPLGDLEILVEPPSLSVLFVNMSPISTLPEERQFKLHCVPCCRRLGSRSLWHNDGQVGVSRVSRETWLGIVLGVSLRDR